MRELKNNRRLLLFLLIFALIFIRYCYYGFEYYYQLDDYIQYHNYYNVKGITSIFKCVEIGLLASRPLAGIADIFVWTRLFGVMIAGVAIVSAMYAASACLFQWVWSRHFGTGIIFIIIYSLLPLGFEGTYWMSASTRIVVGLFFASVALYFFEKWCSNGKHRNLIIYIFAQLIAYGLYEQILIISFTSIILVGLLHIKRSFARSICGLISLVNAIIYFIFVSYFSSLSGESIYSARYELVLPGNSNYFDTFLPELLSQIKSAFIGGGFYTLVKGFKRGLLLLLEQPNLLYIFGILILCALIFIFAKKETPKTQRAFCAIICGLALATAPIAQFFCYFKHMVFASQYDSLFLRYRPDRRHDRSIDIEGLHRPAENYRRHSGGTFAGFLYSVHK